MGSNTNVSGAGKGKSKRKGVSGGSSSGPPSAELQRIAEELAAEIERRDLVQAHIARQAGINKSALSQFLQKKHGLGADKLQSLLRVMGRGRALGSRPIVVDGVVTARGELNLFGGAMLPATVQIDAPFDRFAAGDTIVIEALEEWEPGSILVVRHRVDGVSRLYSSLEIDGSRFLRDHLGDDVRFSTERHEIIGVVVGATIQVARRRTM